MLLKAKCDHIHHACTHGFALTWWRWSRRAFSLLTAYQILSADFIAKGAWQSCISKLQYNTCRRRIKQFSALCFRSFWPHSYHFFPRDWPHVAVGMFLLYSPYVFSPTMKQFSCASTTPETDDHRTIIRYLDLTTSLTINRTGVHGDKMSREYEKAVFA